MLAFRQAAQLNGLYSITRDKETLIKAPLSKGCRLSNREVLMPSLCFQFSHHRDSDSVLGSMAQLVIVYDICSCTFAHTTDIAK